MVLSYCNVYRCDDICETKGDPDSAFSAGGKKIDFIWGHQRWINPSSGSLKRGLGTQPPGTIHFRGVKWLKILIYINMNI